MKDLKVVTLLYGIALKPKRPARVKDRNFFTLMKVLWCKDINIYE